MGELAPFRRLFPVVPRGNQLGMRKKFLTLEQCRRLPPGSLLWMTPTKNCPTLIESLKERKGRTFDFDVLVQNDGRRFVIYGAEMSWERDQPPDYRQLPPREALAVGHKWEWFLRHHHVRRIA
jgi:hypothetical protein